MSSKALAETLVAVYALFLVVTAGLRIISVVESHLLWSEPSEPTVWLTTHPTLASELIGEGMFAAVGVALFLARRVLATLLTKGVAADGEPVQDTGVVRLGICLLGVYLGSTAIPKLVRAFLPLGGVQYPWLVEPLVQLAVGVGMFLGFSGIANLWRAVAPMRSPPN